jgi:hypothetical protein
MRYKLASGIEIRTENAAKPESQPSKFLLDLIANLPHVASTFDYGCGKLRYQRAIANTTDVLAIVDSEVQLSRLQVLRQRETSIRNLLNSQTAYRSTTTLNFRNSTRALNAASASTYCR